MTMRVTKSLSYALAVLLLLPFWCHAAPEKTAVMINSSNQTAQTPIFTAGITVSELRYSAATTLTISVAGAITVTQSAHKVAVNSGTADDLVTVNGGTEGDVVMLFPAESGKTITIKHGSGNLTTPSGVDYDIPDNGYVMLYKTATNWVSVTVAIPGGGGIGDVIGPASSTDDGIVRFNGLTGKTVQDSSIMVNDAGQLVFEGATADDYETIFGATDPTVADKTILLPNASGTVAVSATAPATLSALGDIGVTVAGDIVAGIGLTGGADNVLPGADADVTLTFSAAELNALTWGTGAESTFIWGFDVSGTDTAITFGNGTINVSTGALQVGGAAVLTAEVDGSTTNEINTVTADTGGTTSGLAVTLAGGGIVATSRSGDTVTITGTVPDNYVLTSGDTMTGALVIEHADGVELGKDAATNTAGKVKLWGAGANDYYATLTAPTLTSNAAYKLPVDEPAGTYLLNMTSAGQIGYDATSYQPSASSETLIAGPIQSGTNGTGGIFGIYNELGATDYTIAIQPSASQTGSYALTLPVNVPAGESWLTMGADGIIDYTTISAENWQATLARGAVASITPVCSNSTTALTIGAAIGGVDYRILFDGESSDGTITWMEDEHQFQSTYRWQITGGGFATALEVGDGSSGVDFQITFNGETSDGTMTWMEDERHLYIDGPVRTGKNGLDGQIGLYSEQGETDYSVWLAPADTMTESTTYKLPPAKGAAGTVLTDAAGDGVLSWAAAGGAGTIGGSTGSTDNAILRADGTGGVTLQASAATLSDLSVLAIAGNATNAAGISLAEDTDDGTNTVTIQAQTMDASYTLTLPTSDGAAGEVLKTDGSGGLDWVDLPTSEHAIATAASDTVVDTDDQKIVVVNNSSTPDANTMVLYKMDGTPGAAVFTDATGHTTMSAGGDANTATPPGTHGTGFAQAAYFDNTGDWTYTSLNTYTTVGSGDWTLDFWFYPVTRGNYDGLVTLGNGDDYKADGYVTYGEGNQNKIGFWCTGIGDTMYSGTTVATGAWYHIAIVRDGSTVMMYLNGEVADSESISGSVSSGSTRLLVGDFWGGGVNPANGYFDEVRLSNVARWTEAFTPKTAPYGGADPTYDVSDTKVTSLVVGPSSATDNAVARFDLATGKLVQNSSVTIDDDGHLDTSGKITGLVRVTAYASTGNIAAQDCRGGTVTNTGAGGAVVLTLPDAVQGMSVMILLTAAQDIDVNPQNGEQILVRTDAAGDAISSDATVGSYICLYAVSDTEWMPVGVGGVWTDAD